jgi:hypothetical protein
MPRAAPLLARMCSKIAMHGLGTNIFKTSDGARMTSKRSNSLRVLAALGGGAIATHIRILPDTPRREFPAICKAPRIITPSWLRGTRPSCIIIVVKTSVKQPPCAIRNLVVPSGRHDTHGLDVWGLFLNRTSPAAAG